MPSIVPAVRHASSRSAASVAECHHVPSHVQDGDRHLMDDDEDDAALDDTIVRDFHFGGGFVQKKKSDGAGRQTRRQAEPRKSKKEVSLCMQSAGMSHWLCKAVKHHGWRVVMFEREKTVGRALPHHSRMCEGALCRRRS